MDCFEVLEIEATKDLKIIKKAYAKLLPLHNPEEDPEGFQQLRAAYEEAAAKVKEEASLNKPDTPVEAFMRTFEEYYHDFAKRINTEAWTDLLERDICHHIDTAEEVSERILCFIMNQNSYYPTEVWRLFNKFFAWSTKKEKLYMKFPPNFIDYVVNKIMYESRFRYEYLLSCQDNKQEEFLEEFTKANEFLDQYNLYDAWQSIRICQEICPEHPDLLILISRYLSTDGKIEDAFQLLNTCLARNDEDYPACLTRGHLWVRVGKYEEAYQDYQKAKNIAPDSFDALYYLGKCSISLQKYAEAITNLKQLNELWPYDQNVFMLLTVAQKFRIDELVASNEDNPADPELHYQLAQLYSWVNQLTEAYELLSKLEQKNQLNSERYSLLCNVLLALGKKEVAYTTVNKAIALYPEEGNLYAIKALVLDELGNDDEAVKTYTLALDLNPEDAVSYNNQAYSLNKLQRYDEALESANKAISLEPKLANAYKNKAAALLGLHLYEECLEACEEALNHYLFLAEAYVIKMKLFATVNQYEEALAVYARACDLGINNSNLLYEKADIFRLLDKPDDAIELCDQVLAMDQENYNSYYCKGLCFFEKGNYQEAIECLDQAIAHNSNIEEAYYYKVLSYMNLQTVSQALENLEAIISMNTVNSAMFHNLKGDILMDLEKFEEALKEYKKAIEQNPQKVQAYYGAGKALTALEENEEALKYLDLALERDPSIADIYLDKSYVFSKIAKYEECIAECERALELDLHNLGAYYNKAWSLFHLDEQEAALNCCSKALAIDGNQMNLLSLKLRILHKNRRYDEALAVAERILEMQPEHEAVLKIRKELTGLGSLCKRIILKLFS